MPDLRFSIGAPTSMPYAAIPTIAAPLRITNASPNTPIQSILLNCQIQIEPLGRAYSAQEEARLLDLFGDRSRWARTMKPMLWTIQVLKVPAFAEEATIDIPLPCTMDFDVAATKFFYGLEAGVIPISVLFSGTAFYTDESGYLQATQIPWDHEAKFQLPHDVWRAAIDAHYPEMEWLRLSKETFERLYLLKVARGIPTWDRLLNQILDHTESRVSAAWLAEPTGVKQ